MTSDRTGVAETPANPNISMAPGVPSALSPLVRRIVASNPSLMTGPGTNTYLVGVDEVAVIDPGPADDSHVEAIIGGSMRDRIRWIVLTHTHPDHWPAARALLERTDAKLAAFGPTPKVDGLDLKIDVRLRDGDVLEGSEWGLRVMHTPGHAPNHLCYFLEDERSLFSGDHVLNGTTTVVSPKRGGDMRAYIDSTTRLRALKRLTRILPGHGATIDDPYAKLDEYLAHRAERERQIAALLEEGPQRIKDVVTTLYPDVPEGLVEMARRQVHAHLLDLRSRGLARGDRFTGPWTTG